MRHCRTDRLIVELAAHDESMVVTVALTGDMTRFRQRGRDDRGEDTVAVPRERVERDALEAGHFGSNRGRDVLDACDVGDVTVDLEHDRQLGGDHPVGAGRAGRGDLVRDRGHATFEVRGGAGLLAVGSGGEHDVGELRGLRQVRVDRDHSTRTGERPAGEVGVGAVVERVGAEQDQ